MSMLGNTPNGGVTPSYKFAFYTSAGVLNQIQIAANNVLPFFNSQGNSANISLTV